MKKWLIYFIVTLTLISVVIGGGYMDYVTIGQGDSRWCQLTGCTIEDLVAGSITVSNLSVIGSIFNVTMNIITWNITESFNVGGDLEATNINATGNVTGTGFCFDGTTCIDSWDDVNDTTDLSEYQLNISAQSCSGTDKFSSYDNGTFTCTTDQTAAGGGGTSSTAMNLDIQTSIKSDVLLNVSNAESEVYTMKVRSGRKFVFGGELV